MAAMSVQKLIDGHSYLLGSATINALPISLYVELAIGSKSSPLGAMFLERALTTISWPKLVEQSLDHSGAFARAILSEEYTFNHIYTTYMTIPFFHSLSNALGEAVHAIGIANCHELCLLLRTYKAKVSEDWIERDFMPKYWEAYDAHWTAKQLVEPPENSTASEFMSAAKRRAERTSEYVSDDRLVAHQRRLRREDGIDDEACIGMMDGLQDVWPKEFGLQIVELLTRLVLR